MNGLMRTNLSPISGAPTDTTSPARDTDRLPNGVAVVVDRDARLFRESLTRCRRDVSSPITDAHIRNLTKKVDTGRAQPGRLILELLHDAFARGAPRAAVEDPVRCLLAIVGHWYEVRDHAQQIDFLSLVTDDTHAQAAADVVEMQIIMHPSRKTIADAVLAIDAHLNALDALSVACHRRLAEAA